MGVAAAEVLDEDGVVLPATAGRGGVRLLDRVGHAVAEPPGIALGVRGQGDAAGDAEFGELLDGRPGRRVTVKRGPSRRARSAASRGVFSVSGASSTSQPVKARSRRIRDACLFMAFVGVSDAPDGRWTARPGLFRVHHRRVVGRDRRMAVERAVGGVVGL